MATILQNSCKIRLSLFFRKPMLRSFYLSREWAWWAWGGLAVLFTSVWAQVQMLVLLNEWYEQFYNMMQNAPDPDITLGDFWDTLIQFAGIAFFYITIATFSGFFSRHYAFRWRQAMTFTYLPIWRETTSDIEGSSQRIQEDAARFARIVESLGLELFESILKVVAFAPILWMLSSHVDLPYVRDIPGSLVWVVIAMSFGGILISYVVGIKLPGLEYNNQRREAAFRKQLVYAEDDKVHAAMPTMVELFTGVRLNYFRLFLHYAYFDLWRIFYLQSAVLVPLVMMGPAVIVGGIGLGVMLKASHAFREVSDSVAYLIRSWTTITELLSVIKRLREFERNIGYGGKTPTPPPDDKSVQVVAAKAE